MPALAQADDFRGLGFLPGGTISSPNGVSADGAVVVGVGTSAAAGGNVEAFRWSGGVMTGLGFLPGGTYSEALAVSADGSVVVGYGTSIAAGGNTEAFRWTQSGGMVGLGVLTGGTNSLAAGVSADGSVVVGYGTSTAAGAFNNEAFRWTQGGGMTGLGFLPGAVTTYSVALGVSADGSVVVGYGTSAAATPEAFRWTQGGGMVGLGLLPGGSFSQALGVSADGLVVIGVGDSTASAIGEAFRWSGGVMTGLGLLTGGTRSIAYGVSADGSVVVGYATSTAAPTGEAFRWTQSTGIKSIKDLLVASGVNMTGWSLASAYGVAANGSVIVGYGLDPSSHAQAWFARLCDIDGCSGLVTVSDQMNSFASVGGVGQTASASLGMNFNTVTNYATQGGTPTSPGSPFSAFTAFGYDSDPTVAGTLGGTAKLNDRGLIVGATLGADNIRTTNMHEGGSARFNAGTLGLFIAQVPAAGWQWLAGANAIYLTGKISRGYVNGASPATSTGSTHGQGYGLAGRVGYTFANVLPRTSLTPFAAYTFTRVDFAGYTETDGPFPAMVDSFHDVEQVARVGADARYTFEPGTWTWGALAWGHRLDAGKSPDVSGTLIGLFPLAASGATTNRRDWVEATAGIRYGAWKNGAVTASLTASIPANAPTTYAVQFGVSQAF